MIKSLAEARITDALPRALGQRDHVKALSDAVGVCTEKILCFADESQIYTALDTANEKILDTLAVNWKIDWYDSGMDLEQKRRVVKNAIAARKVMGTAAAVNLQADAIYPGAGIEEWFLYGGRPGCFRLVIPLGDGGLTGDEFRRLLRGMEWTKNARSHLEHTLITRECTGGVIAGGHAAVMNTVEVFPKLVREVKSFGYALAGGQARSMRRVEIFP